MPQKSKKIVIFGYGMQGSAQALNLRDSGKDIVVCLKPESKHIQRAKDAGLTVITDDVEAASIADIAVILIPDSGQAALYKISLEKNLPPAAAMIFAHGISIHYKWICPRNNLDVILVAPLGQGEAVRQEYKTGSGIPTLIAVAGDYTGKAWEIGCQYATAIAKNANQFRSTFAEEVEIDLFTEQAVIVGGLSELILAGFDTLVDAGYKPEIAYYCTLKEAKLMMDLFAEHGPAKTMQLISDTARYGALTRGPSIVTEDIRAHMRKLLDEIRSGSFQKELECENKTNGKKAKQLITKLQKHLITKLHSRLNKETE